MIRWTLFLIGILLGWILYLAVYKIRDRIESLKKLGNQLHENDLWLEDQGIRTSITEDLPDERDTSSPD